MPAPSLVVTNARIFTGDPELPEAEGLAVRGGRVVKLGSDSSIEALAGASTRILDARGRRVLPGFIDAHVHLIWGYELGEWIDLSGSPGYDAVRRRVRAYAKRHPEETVLVGHGFDYAALASKGLPTKEDLDAIVDDRPAILTAWDGHTGWANSRFFEGARPVLARVGRATGDIVRNPRTGEPTGILYKAFDLTPHLPEFRSRRSLDGLRRRVREASSFGITTAFDVQVNYEHLNAYASLARRGELPLRVRVAIYHPRRTSPRLYPKFRAAMRRYQEEGFTVGAIKLYIDGVQETGTAALLDPYSNNTRSRGVTVYTIPEYRTIVTRLDRLGFQVLTHACGDRGVRTALDAYEHAARVNRTRGRRHRVEHCENLSAKDIPRFARLGVIPCMMPRHSSPELTVQWRVAVGPRRTRSAFPWRELLTTGAALAFSSDWPVSELNPMIGVHQAVNRVAPDGRPSPQRLTVPEAIRAYTSGAAFASHCDNDRGTLSTGRLADFIVLHEDPLETPTPRLREVRVDLSFVGGAVTFRRPGAGPGPR